MAVIPVVLGTGPIGGYLIAELLIKKLGFPEITGVVCITLGFLAGVQETVKIVKIALKARE